jgi:hypothetical protein
MLLLARESRAHLIYIVAWFSSCCLLFVMLLLCCCLMLVVVLLLFAVVDHPPVLLLPARDSDGFILFILFVCWMIVNMSVVAICHCYDTAQAQSLLVDDVLYRVESILEPTSLQNIVVNYTWSPCFLTCPGIHRFLCSFCFMVNLSVPGIE